LRRSRHTDCMYWTAVIWQIGMSLFLCRSWSCNAIWCREYGARAIISLLQSLSVHTVCKHRSSPKVPLSMRTFTASCHKQSLVRKCSRAREPQPRPGATTFQHVDASLPPADRKPEQMQGIPVGCPQSQLLCGCCWFRVSKARTTDCGLVLPHIGTADRTAYHNAMQRKLACPSADRSTRSGVRVRALAVRSHRDVHEQ
jgi:hypothetical protein